MSTETIIGFLIWYMIGFVSFIWHWTYDYDYTSKEVLLSLGLGFLGPMTFAIGFIFHPRSSKDKRTKVLISRR